MILSPYSYRTISDRIQIDFLMMEGICEDGEGVTGVGGARRREQGAAGLEGEGVAAQRDDVGWTVVCSKKRKQRNSSTPEALRKMGSCGEKIDFEGFDQEESSNQGKGEDREKDGVSEDRGKFEEYESQLKMLNFTMASLLERQEQKENALKNKCEAMEKKMIELNKEFKKNMEQLKSENKDLRERCIGYEKALKEVNEKITIGNAMGGEDKVEELKNAWRVERKTENESFREMMNKEIKEQLQEKTREEVVKVIKEKQNLVRDTVEKKKCMVIFGMKEKRNEVRSERERELRESVRKLVGEVQDEEQNLEEEIEEVVRLGKFREEGVRPIKVRMRSQAAAEEILTKTGRLARKSEYERVWIKRDMNEEERKQEKDLREEAKEKNQRRTENEEKEFYWRVMDMRLRKWYIRERGAVGGRQLH